jgi:hypothetical protein
VLAAVTLQAALVVELAAQVVLEALDQITRVSLHVMVALEFQTHLVELQPSMARVVVAVAMQQRVV